MRYFKNEQINYSNEFYVYDIESTKYEENIDTPIMGYSYLHGIKKYIFSTDITKDNLLEYSYNYTPIRTNQDMENKFVEINNEAKHNNEKILILVHNLTYEFYNAIFNMPLLHNELQNNSKSIFAISSTKILKIEIGNLVFIDTLILFGKSLKVCGSEIGMVKNEEHKTYNEIWTEQSDLPEWEYSYNENDLDLVAVYFSKFIRLLNLKSNDINSFMKTKIMTQTGMVKYVCKKINSPEALNQQRKITVETQKSIKPEIQKWIENEVFRGGFCVSVPCNSFCINDKVHSIDFASAYPAVMCTAVYPKGKLIKSDGSRIIELNNFMSRDNFNYKYFWNTDRLYQPYKMFLFKIKIKNVNIKTFENDNEIMYISKAKCQDVHSSSVVVNGRIISSPELITSGTELDFILMKLFYDFEIDTIINEYVPSKIGRLSEYKILSISKFAVEKEAFKKLENSCDSYSSFINKCNERLVNELTYGDVFKSTNVEITDNMQHIKDVCHTYLMSAKGKLNAQYGIGVQHQFQQQITYNNYKFDIDENEKLNWNKNENYLQGIYITAHTRFRLLLMALHLINNNFDIIYFDTDSIKLKGNKEELFTILNDWNNKIELLRNRVKNKYYEKNLFISNFGNFDYEGTYDYFITHGSKRYVTVTNDKCSCTISGVNKKANSSGATLFYKKYGLEKLYYYWCGLNTLFDYPLSKRSINFIPDRPMLIDTYVIDDNGKRCHIHQNSCEGISEKDCGYLLSSYDNPYHSLIRWYYYCTIAGSKKHTFKICMKPHSIVIDSPVYDDDGYLISGDIRVEDGYVIEKYAEKILTKWKKYFQNPKTADYDDAIYKSEHNFASGVLIKNDCD